MSPSGEYMGHIGVSEDITERTQAEQAMRDSREFAQSTIDALLSNICVLNETGAIIAVNRAWKDFGAANSRLDSGEAPPADAVQSSDGEGANYLSVCDQSGGPEASEAAEFANGIRAVLSGECEQYSKEYQCDSPDEQRSFLCRVTRFFSNELPRIVIEHIDITERKQMEQALQSSEEKFRQLAENITEVFWMMNAPGTEILYIGSAYEQIWGRTCESLYKAPMDWIEAIYPGDREQAHETFLKQLQGESVDSEYRISTPDGHERWIRDRAFPIRDGEGQIIRVAGIAEEITERKRAEQILRNSEEKFRELAENIREVFFVMTPSGSEVLYISPAVKEVWGLTVESLYENPMSWMDAIHPDDREQAGLLAMRQLQGELVASEYRIRASDGREKWIRARTSPIRDQSGELIRIVGIAEEVTEQKHHEQELIHARKGADAANEAKSEFLANMSHEIRTPMNGVIGITELMLDTALTAEQRRYAEIVRDSGESLLEIINNILDFSKIEARKLELETVDFDLPCLLDNVLGTLSAQAQAKGIELLCIADAAIPNVLCGDPGRLRQILTNLVGNSVKFTGKGEVVVRATVDEDGESDCLVRFSVRDTGMGIPQDKIGILFDSFSQVDISTTRKFGGTGLGLAISRQLAELMGGEIGVTSQEGVGSEFWVTARLRRAIEHEDARTEINQPAILSGVRVLIVDDNATSREILTTLIAGWGMRPSETDGGPSALQALYRAREENDPFHVAVIDMQMPGMDGEGLGRAIRADVRLADTRMVMLSSLGIQHGARHYGQIGFFSCATKPVRRQELLSLLTFVMSASAGSRFEPAKTLNGVPAQVNREQSQPFAGMNARILVVEDNATNQEVALGILKKLGLRADAVGDGAQAIASLESIPYDLVLMDMRMPVMDGIEATRQIRNPLSTVLNHDVSIIAMTANAMESDRENCLNAGMNDFVPKPISMVVLRGALQKWLRRGNADNPTKASQFPPLRSAESEPVVFDWAGVLERLEGDKDLAMIVIESFLEDLPLQIQVLKGLVENGDTAGSARQVHSIRGASANVGGERLRKVATEMEEAADVGDLDAVDCRMDELREQVFLLRDAIDKACYAKPSC
jgi:PAS domain S-box-containing protein